MVNEFKHEIFKISLLIFYYLSNIYLVYKATLVALIYNLLALTELTGPLSKQAASIPVSK